MAGDASAHLDGHRQRANPLVDRGRVFALYDVAVDLTKQIARDGEGAHSLIEVHVDQARDSAQAKRVAKAIVNSPLVKTAVHGGDPNWGRVAMAIGKCSDDTDIDQDLVVHYTNAEARRLLHKYRIEKLIVVDDERSQLRNRSLA